MEKSKFYKINYRGLDLEIERKPNGKFRKPYFMEKEIELGYGGFQPKPAVEIIIVAMKPMIKDTYIAQSLSRVDEEEQILKEIEKEHGIEIER
jgi:hypothetical protein